MLVIRRYMPLYHPLAGTAYLTSAHEIFPIENSTVVVAGKVGYRTDSLVPVDCWRFTHTISAWTTRGFWLLNLVEAGRGVCMPDSFAVEGLRNEAVYPPLTETWPRSPLTSWASITASARGLARAPSESSSKARICSTTRKSRSNSCVCSRSTRHRTRMLMSFPGTAEERRTAAQGRVRDIQETRRIP